MAKCPGPLALWPKRPLDTHLTINLHTCVQLIIELAAILGLFEFPANFMTVLSSKLQHILQRTEKKRSYYFVVHFSAVLCNNNKK